MKNAVESFKLFATTLNKQLILDSKKVKAAYYNRREYTLKMKKIIDNTMEEYGRLYNRAHDSAKEFRPFPEYYTIDYTFWNTNKCKGNKVNLFDWELMTAIEHENDWMDWTYEVAKLDFIKAPLKVVIGYMKNDLRDKELSMVEAQYKNLKNVSDDEAFGVILLNRDLDETFTNMRAYVFTAEGVKLI